MFELAKRDRIGLTPVYYRQYPFLVSATAGELGKVPDPQGVKEYKTFQFTDLGRTMYQGVKELPPGHRILYENEDFRVEKWAEDIPIREAPEAEIVAELRTQLEAAVEREVEPGAGMYLSGGLDSSTVAAIAGLPCYHGFYPGFDGKYDERRYARLLGLPLTEIPIQAKDFRDNIHDIIRAMDYPAGGPGVVGQYLVARNVRHKVMLCGEGPDELFGGYHRYRLPGHYFLRVRRDAGKLEDYEHMFPPGEHDIAYCAAFDLKYTLRALLHVDYRVNKAFGIDSRTPLLSEPFVEFVLSIPPAIRFQGWKGLLRKASGAPAEILERTDKMGFTMPFDEWAQGELKDLIGDYLPDTTLTGRSLWGALCLAIWKEVKGSQ